MCTLIEFVEGRMVVSKLASFRLTRGGVGVGVVSTMVGVGVVSTLVGVGATSRLGVSI